MGSAYIDGSLLVQVREKVAWGRSPTAPTYQSPIFDALDQGHISARSTVPTLTGFHSMYRTIPPKFLTVTQPAVIGFVLQNRSPVLPRIRLGSRALVFFTARVTSHNRL